MLSRKDIATANSMARYQDKEESQKWPVCGLFSVAERAIRQARKIRQSSPCESIEEYVALLDNLMSQIVNSVI